MSGIVQAVIFHPWDRALYLSQTKRRKFTNMLNWRDPFQGLPATLALRILTASIFFPLEEGITPIAENTLGAGGFAHFVSGNIAGGVSAVVLNPIQAVRYRTFSLVNSNQLALRKDTFFRTARDMAQTGGITPFLKGINPTLGRDLVFGGLFTLLRRSFADKFVDKEADNVRLIRFACDVTAAAIATTASSPFNYARNIMYATPSSAPSQKTFAIVGKLLANASRRPTLALQARYLQQNLKIGAATFRVALSMAMAASTYDLMKQLIGDHRTEQAEHKQS